MTVFLRRLKAGDPGQLAEALDKLKMLHGDAPHDGGSNICRGDGYFAASIVKDYGVSIRELEELVGYKSDSQIRKERKDRIAQLEAENAALRAELDSIKSKGRVVDRIDVNG